MNLSIVGVAVWLVFVLAFLITERSSDRSGKIMEIEWKRVNRRLHQLLHDIDHWNDTHH